MERFGLMQGREELYLLRLLQRRERPDPNHLEGLQTEERKDLRVQGVLQHLRWTGTGRDAGGF